MIEGWRKCRSFIYLNTFFFEWLESAIKDFLFVSSLAKFGGVAFTALNGWNLKRKNKDFVENCSSSFPFGKFGSFGKFGFWKEWNRKVLENTSNNVDFYFYTVQANSSLWCLRCNFIIIIIAYLKSTHTHSSQLLMKVLLKSRHLWSLRRDEVNGCGCLTVKICFICKTFHGRLVNRKIVLKANVAVGGSGYLSIKLVQTSINISVH